MKVLVTGGSGFLGINLIRLFLRREVSVISLDRLDFDYPERTSIEAVQGDIRDYPLVENLAERVDAIVHAAAALPLYSPEEIFSIDVGGTENVLKAALNKGVRRVVHISTTAVYGIPDHHPLYEDDRLIGVGPYGEAKIRAEELCREYREKGIAVTVIRPKSFIGPERLGIFSLLFEWAAEGRNFPIPGKGDNRYQFLDVEDLCEFIYLCLTGDPSIVSDLFNLGAREFTTLKEDYQAVLDAAGQNGRIISVPEKPAVAVLRILEKLKLSPIYKWIYETMPRDSFVSSAKAEEIMHFIPRFSNKEALIRSFNWYMANRQSFADKKGITHRVPWKQGAIKIMKLFFR